MLKRGVLANLAAASFAHLVQVIRHGLKKIQYQPRLIEGCLAGTCGARLLDLAWAACRVGIIAE